MCARVRQAGPFQRCQTANLTPQATLKRMERKRSRKEQLLPALLVLLSRPLLCADSRADFVLGCSHAERGEQEELGYAAGLCLLLLWLWFNHRRVTLYPGTLNEGRNVLTLSLLMEVKAKGVSAQRGDRQPLNVRRSCSKPQLPIHTHSCCDFKMASCLQLEPEQLDPGSGGARPGGVGVTRCYLSGNVQRLTFSDLFHCHFHLLKLETNKARLVDQNHVTHSLLSLMFNTSRCRKTFFLLACSVV